ncbi:c-type cytochrome domain-containing protein [Puia dinghuensis]|uniref:Cytochrome C Planctomycete-type domain-containing protein n=1 Tax=Puia dinghuensis TaxID=1792502 RepID=A0A8J2XTR0_9BACT|nr:c-type cytochrome domain-containing protein [Puia dinghuensis]GGB01260.1 hypothetical protein GCM10011511_25720 [Puia dinghuensis]
MRWIAHFHPVIVHLPIGMLLAALLLQVLSGRPAYAALRPAVPVVLLAGAVSAIASCVTGWLLAADGDYEESLVAWHRWLGISLTLLSLVVYWRVRRRGFDRMHTLLSLGLLALVVVTGHLGGSLTHGSDYLAVGGSASPASAEVDSPIVNVQAAKAYAEIVRPILRDNCFSCHGATRQKGGLRMDETAALMKGGKDGVVIEPGNGSGSELIKRLLLPEEEEHHMPPKQKKQLTERQIALLHWWIDQGADFTRRVAELKQPDSVRPALLAVQSVHPRTMVSDVPSDAVEAPDRRAVEALRAKGVLVMPVAQNSNWLDADLSGAAAAGSKVQEVVVLLSALKKQLLSLRVDHTDVGDSGLAAIGQCVALRSLDLAGTRITDAGLAALRGLRELRVLNLVGTGVSVAGVEGLKRLTKLRAIYLYGTKVGHEDWTALKKAFPKTMLDTGGYSLPVLATDTAVVRAPAPGGPGKK